MLSDLSSAWLLLLLPAADMANDAGSSGILPGTVIVARALSGVPLAACAALAGDPGAVLGLALACGVLGFGP